MPKGDDRGEAVFVGRRRELAELQASLADVVAGRGRFFLVVGEPGIGKTRLVEELAREAGERGSGVLWGTCWEGAGAPPYWPWTQVLRACLRTIGAEPLHRVLGAGAAYVARLLPELDQHAGDRSAPSTSPDAEHARFYLFDAVATFLQNAAARMPLVLVLDDLQWADASSLLLLQFVSQELREARLLVLGTYRDVDVRETPATAELLGALAGKAHHVPLRGLPEDDVRLFIERTSGRSPSDALVRAVHRETDGNPFLVDEIVRLLVAEEALERPDAENAEGFPVPQGVRAAICRRLAPLPASCRDALALAAVAGRDVELGVLEHACSADGRAVLETLGPALAREIVVRDAEHAGRYGFVHALIREAVYAEIAPAERARLHQRIGEALERFHWSDPTPHLAALAHHFMEAGNAEKALDYSTRAARHAAASFGYETAAAHFQSALDALDRAHPDDDRGRCELVLARGGALSRSGDGRAARDAFARAAEIARRVGDAVLLARAALGFAGEGARFLWVRSGVVDQARIALLEEAVDALGERDFGLRARLLARLAINLYWSADAGRCLALGDEAVTLARRLGDPQDLAAALAARWIALWRPEAAGERLAIADEIVQLGMETRDREIGLLGRRFRIVGFLEHGDVVAADREIETWARDAGELRVPLYLTDVAMWRATRAIMDGRFTEGEEQARRAVELGEREPEVQAGMRHAVQTSVILFHRSRPNDDVRAADVASFEPSTLLRCHRILLAADSGRTTGARRHLDTLAKDVELRRDGSWLVSMSLLAVAAAELEEATIATRLYELLLPFADRLAIMAAGIACWGSVSYYLGILASAIGRVDDAVRHLEHAAIVHERIGSRPFLAWTQLAHARLLLRHERRDEAAARAASALRIADELGMDRLLARMRGLGIDVATTARTHEPADGDAVFRNEGDFWTVAYAGTTARLRHAKGLGDIAILLGSPGKEIHVADLIAASAGPPPDARITDRADGLRVARDEPRDAMLDGRATADYRHRLAELHEELDDAERCNDPGRSSRARAELDFIAGELASTFGLGGRARRTGSRIERARKAVASRIRFSLTHIARVHPALARHLRDYIRTGTVCTYVVPDDPVHWRT